MLRDQLAALDGAISQYFTGNTCGLYCEIIGWKGNRAFRRSSAPLAKQIRAEGAAPFTPDFGRDEIARLSGLLDAFERYRDTGEAQDGIESWMLPSLVVRPNTVRLSGEPDVIDGFIAQMSDKVQQQLHRELGAQVKSMGITLYRNRPTADMTTISGDWHFDRRPTDWMRAFIYLSDVDEECGPFHFFDRQRSTQLCRRGFKRKSQSWQRRVEAQPGFRRLTGSAGSGLLANAERILHRAGNPAEGRHRDMFEFIFRPLRG